MGEGREEEEEEARGKDQPAFSEEQLERVGVGGACLVKGPPHPYSQGTACQAKGDTLSHVPKGQRQGVPGC